MNFLLPNIDLRSLLLLVFFMSPALTMELISDPMEEETKEMKECNNFLLLNGILNAIRQNDCKQFIEKCSEFGYEKSCTTIEQTFGFIYQAIPSLGHIAVESNANDILKFLKKMNFDFTTKGNQRYSPLFYVRESALMDWFKSHMAIDNAEGFTGKTPLLFACACGNLELVKQYIEQYNSSYINQKDYKGRGLLSYAAISGNNQLLSYLIDKGLTLSTDQKALDLAKSKEVIKLLLCSADKNGQRIEKLNEALYMAIKFNNTEVVNAVLSEGADAKYSKNGETVLQLAHELQHQEIVELLKEFGANIKIIKKR